MQALQVFAGPRARERLRERGLRPQDVRAIPGAAGGPKGLVLNALDRFLFGHWLPRSTQVVHLPGASIGAWRLACACLPDADAALAQLVDDYIAQRYEHAPGKPPAPGHVSEVFGAKLRERFGGREHEVLGHVGHEHLVGEVVRRRQLDGDDDEDARPERHPARERHRAALPRERPGAGAVGDGVGGQHGAGRQRLAEVQVHRDPRAAVRWRVMSRVSWAIDV